MRWVLSRLVPLAVILVVFIAQVGLGRKIVRNTIDPTAALSDQGRRVTLAGPISCDQVEAVDLRVTLTQRTTGAFAGGRIRFIGTTTQQRWELVATTLGGANFEPGPAIAVAVAVSSLRGKATDAHQWLVPITLHAE